MTTKLIENMPGDIYHFHHAISKSGLDLIQKSPYHYWAERLCPDPEMKKRVTQARKIGTAFHLLVLEPDLFKAQIAIAPELDLRTKAGKAEWRAFEDANRGKALLRHKEMEGLREMASAIRNHAGARFLLKGKGKVEASIFYHNDEFDIDCRARPDWIRDDGVIVDVKTTNDASLDAFGKSIWNYGYYIQDAMYRDAYAELGEKAASFVFIAVENKPPYGVSLHTLPDDYVDIGRRNYKFWMQRFAECWKANDWPGYGNEIYTQPPPSWAA